MPGDSPEAVAAAVAGELDRLAPPWALGVAVSGGSDSTALLLIVRRWAEACGRRLAAATVDHRLRSDSAAEARSVAELCRALGVPHETLRTGDLRAVRGNLSAAARDARLVLLADWADRHDLAAVLLGHTLDDQAETVLLRLARGSGAEGLAAMEPAVHHHGVLWLRPLLGQRRQALQDLLRAEGVGWTEDPSNEDPAYDRVKARRALAVLAPLGIGPEGLARTAERLARQRRVLERAMCSVAIRARIPGALGEARLDLRAMTEDEEDTALRLLADTLRRVAGETYRPRFASLSAAWKALAAGDTRTMTLGGCLIVADPGSPGTVLVCREPAACEGQRPLAGAAVWDKRWALDAMGPWPAGTRIGALGRTGIAALAAAARRGAWTQPAPWSAAPSVVRSTVPALWAGSGEPTETLLAAPLAGYLERGPSNAGCAILARFTGWEELPSPVRTD